MGDGDYVMGDSVISKCLLTWRELGHNLFSVGQFCVSESEVAFLNAILLCLILRVPILKGSRSTNLYTISIDEMMKSTPICLLSKASKSKSWLWHRSLNHLNFGTINDLARKDLVMSVIYEGVGIFHQKSVLRTPQQNGVVERRNQTLVEAARTMMIFFESSHLILPFSEYFGALCYPSIDSEDLGKFQSQADIGIFVGYTPSGRAIDLQ
ncbi:integrase, catalytic region, zinc finger, CCHC-type containing protein [Tanacetum coccineum]